MSALIISITAILISFYTLALQARLYRQQRRERMKTLAFKKMIEENLVKEIDLKFPEGTNLYRIGPHTLKAMDYKDLDGPA